MKPAIEVEVVGFDRHAWLNAHNWQENISGPMSQADFEAFQAGLDEIVGVESSGIKRLRVVWGQSTRSLIYDRYHQQWRLRYDWASSLRPVIDPATGVARMVREWVGVPRYFIEAWVPPVHNEAERERDAAGGVEADGTVVAPAVREHTGQYMTATPILTHSLMKDPSGWRVCCLRAVKAEHKCWGAYREPDEQDLEQVRQGLRERQEARLSSPAQALTARDRQELYLDWMTETMRRYRRNTDELNYRKQDILRTVMPWRDGVPGKKGRWG